MNSRTKLLCVFFLMTICLSFSTLLGAFAETVPEDTPSSVTAVTENTSSKGNSVPSGTAVSSRANSSAALSSRASSAPPKSSASSKKKRRRRKVSSAPVSSAVSEVDVFGVLSSAGTSDSDVISLPEVDSIPERDPQLSGSPAGGYAAGQAGRHPFVGLHRPRHPRRADRRPQQRQAAARAGPQALPQA